MYIKKCIYSVGKTKTIRHLLFILKLSNLKLTRIQIISICNEELSL